MTDLDPALKAAMKSDVDRFGPRPAYLPQNPVAERMEMRRRRVPWNVGGPTMTRTLDLKLEVAGRTIPSRIHWPTGSPRGTILYVHGGGWVAGDLDTHDRTVRSLAAISGAAAISIAYRKAPEHPFPAGLDDVIDGWEWLIREGASMGLDTAALAIAGDSAGANLALAASQVVQSRGQRSPDTHILFYGIYDADLETESYRTLGDGRYGLGQKAMADYWDLYLPHKVRRRAAEASPIHGRLTDGKRPLLLWAALDPLRDDNRNLAKAFNAAGNSAISIEVHSVTHGFLHYGECVGAARLGLDCAGHHVRQAFGSR